jgi:hypothetical protein
MSFIFGHFFDFDENEIPKLKVKSFQNVILVPSFFSKKQKKTSQPEVS